MYKVVELKSGKCRIKPGAINKLGKNIKIRFGRGKNFDYKYITENKAIVYKKGIQFTLNRKELDKYFYIY